MKNLFCTKSNTNKSFSKNSINKSKKYQLAVLSMKKNSAKT